MRKHLLILALVLSLVLATASGAAAGTLRVGATPVPHAEILEAVAPILAEQGITLQIIEFTDYVQPNLALQDGDLDANFFQHIPYLESFNEGRGTTLVAVGGVHVEPLGIYSSRIESLEDLPNGAQVSIPNDVTNGGRALLLLQAAGLITVDEATGITPTVFDITDNPKNLRFHELEAAQLSRSLDDVTIAVINGNYALQANFVPTEDSLFLEGSESPYVNVVAVKAGNEDNELVQALVEAIRSDAIRDFIQESYPGSVVPAF